MINGNFLRFYYINMIVHLIKILFLIVLAHSTQNILNYGAIPD